MSTLLEGIVLGVHLVTAHSAGGLEPVNPGVYVRTASGITAGVLHNSYSRTSLYGGYTWETADKRFALTVGAITGYPAKPVLPFVAPSVRFGLGGDVSARLAFMPKPPHYGHSHGLHLSVERQF